VTSSLTVGDSRLVEAVKMRGQRQEVPLVILAGTAASRNYLWLFEGLTAKGSLSQDGAPKDNSNDVKGVLGDALLGDRAQHNSHDRDIET